MKCLTVTVDDRELFSGEVTEISWSETDESVTVTGRFKSAPSLMQSLQQIVANAKQQQPQPPEPNDSPPAPPKLSVVEVDDHGTPEVEE